MGRKIGRRLKYDPYLQRDLETNGRTGFGNEYYLKAEARSFVFLGIRTRVVHPPVFGMASVTINVRRGRWYRTPHLSTGQRAIMRSAELARARPTESA